MIVDGARTLTQLIGLRRVQLENVQVLIPEQCFCDRQAMLARQPFYRFDSGCKGQCDVPVPYPRHAEQLVGLEFPDQVAVRI